jgi:two-component system, NarL family, invasion response regulator UvrY
MGERGSGIHDGDKRETVRALLIVRAGGIHSEVRGRIEREADLEIAASATNGASALETMRRVAFDLVLVDAGALGPDAASVVRSIAHDAAARLPVVIFGPESDECAAARLLAAGALAYVADGAPGAGLAEAIRAARAGKRYISASLRDRMAFKYVDGQ